MSVTTNYSGKTVIISGGQGDIGQACVRRYLQAGARVASGDIKEVKAEERGAYGALSKQGFYHPVKVDISDSRAVETWVEEVERMFGPPDIVVCNAAIVEPISLLKTEPSSWERQIAVNLSGGYYLARFAALRMLHHGIQGRIVFVGSWAGHVPHPLIGGYSPAKAGLRMLMQCLALELAPHGILVNEVAPGFVDAGLSRELFEMEASLREVSRRKTPEKKLIPADAVAREIVRLSDPKLEHFVGSVSLMDGGLSLKAMEADDD